MFGGILTHLRRCDGADVFSGQLLQQRRLPGVVQAQKDNPHFLLRGGLQLLYHREQTLRDNHWNYK